MKIVTKLIFVALLLLILSACSAGMAGSPSALRSDVEIFRVGELEIRLYQNQDSMARELPASLALVDALRVGGKRLRVLGYYDNQNKRIYSINNARVLLHEIKHYLEPNWRHEIGSDYLEAMRQGVQFACVDCTASAQQKNSLSAPATVLQNHQERAPVDPDDNF